MCRVERKAKHQYNRHALSSATFPQRLLFMFFYSFPFLALLHSLVCFIVRSVVVVLPSMSAIRATSCRFVAVAVYICNLHPFCLQKLMLAVSRAGRRCKNNNDTVLVLCSVCVGPPHSIIILTIVCEFPVTELPFSSPPTE